MWDYSDTVKEHFYNPRNAGLVEGANATGDVGSLSCGDALRLMLKVNPKTEVIEQAGFQTFGCGSAIASSSALTEIIKGMTIDEALKVSNQDIANYLDGLPPEKMHCSVMGQEALQAAVANYRGEVWKDDHEEGALLCKCFAVDELLIEQTIRSNHLTSVEEVAHYTKAGGGCTSCHEGIEEILARVLAQDTEAENVSPSISSTDEGNSTGGSTMTMLQRIKRIESVIQSMRPQFQLDKGDIELVEVLDDRIYVKLSGACNGCQMSALSLGDVQQRLLDDLGEIIRVCPAEELTASRGELS